MILNYEETRTSWSFMVAVAIPVTKPVEYWITQTCYWVVSVLTLKILMNIDQISLMISTATVLMVLMGA